MLTTHRTYGAFLLIVADGWPESVDAVLLEQRHVIYAVLFLGEHGR